MTTWTLPRLSVEWVGPITVQRNGVTVTGWTYTILPATDQPTTTTAIGSTPTTISGQLGILIGPGTTHPLTVGTYRIWIRYVDNPEAPVLNNVGSITIT